MGRKPKLTVPVSIVGGEKWGGGGLYRICNHNEDGPLISQSATMSSSSGYANSPKRAPPWPLNPRGPHNPGEGSPDLVNKTLIRA
jgi:hypothetical protein